MSYLTNYTVNDESRHIKLSICYRNGVQLYNLPVTKGNEGDVIVVYLKSKGFVGVGKIVAGAKMIREVLINGKSLLGLPLQCKKMNENSESETLSEYVCKVHWIKVLPREEAKWRQKPKLYTTTHVRASLEGQPETIKFIQEEFQVDLNMLIE